MPRIDLKALTDLFDAELEKYPERRRDLVTRVGERLKTELDIQIDQSGIDDSSGRMKRYQVLTVGSGGGYSAIRPMNAKESDESGKNSPGAITGYVVRGHSIRSPSGKDPGYRPRIRVARVPAYDFYEATLNVAEGIALAESEAFLDELAAAWEG